MLTLLNFPFRLPMLQVASGYLFELDRLLPKVELEKEVAQLFKRVCLDGSFYICHSSIIHKDQYL